MSLNQYLPKKFDPIPKRHHFFAFFLFICGFLLPPIAVLARFGVGRDFFINIIMTLCGYFPGHGHNFYLQNIRNNENKNRTPKWARKAGLVDPRDQERRDAKSQWKKRFDERNNVSTHVGADLEEGEEGGNYVPVDPREEERRARMRSEGLWTGDDEEFYNEDRAPNQRHHHYPMNFEGTDAEYEEQERRRPDRSDSGGGGGERDPVTGALIGGNAYSSSNGNGYPRHGATDADVPEWGKDYGSRKQKKSKNPLKRNKKSSEAVGGNWDNGASGASGYGRGGYDDMDDRAGRSGGGGYGGGASAGRVGSAGTGGYGGGANAGRGGSAGGGGGAPAPKKKSNDPFDHEF